MTGLDKNIPLRHLIYINFDTLAEEFCKYGRLCFLVDLKFATQEFLITLKKELSTRVDNLPTLAVTKSEEDYHRRAKIEINPILKGAMGNPGVALSPGTKERLWTRRNSVGG